MPYFDEEKYALLKKNQKAYASEIATAKYSLRNNEKTLSQYMQNEKEHIATTENINESFSKLYESYMTVTQAYMQTAQRLERKFDTSIELLKKEMKEFIACEASRYAEKRIDTVDSFLEQHINELSAEARETAKKASDCIGDAEAKIIKECDRLRFSLRGIQSESFFFSFFGNKFNLIKLAVFWVFFSLFTSSMFFGYANLEGKSASTFNLVYFFFMSIIFMLVPSTLFWLEGYNSNTGNISWLYVSLNFLGLLGIILATNAVLFHTVSFFLF